MQACLPRFLKCLLPAVTCGFSSPDDRRYGIFLQADTDFPLVRIWTDQDSFHFVDFPNIQTRLEPSLAFLIRRVSQVPSTLISSDQPGELASTETTSFPITPEESYEAESLWFSPSSSRDGAPSCPRSLAAVGRKIMMAHAHEPNTDAKDGGHRQFRAGIIPGLLTYLVTRHTEDG